MDIRFTTQIFKEGRTFVAYTRELDVSSCGGAREKALQNLQEAVRLFLDEANRMGTLEQILDGPKLIGARRIPLPLPTAPAKA